MSGLCNILKCAFLIFVIAAQSPFFVRRDCAIWISQDTTNLQKSREKIDTQRQQLAEILNNIPAYIAVKYINYGFKYIFWNKFAAVAIYAITADKDVRENFDMSCFNGTILKPVTLDKIIAFLEH